MNQTTDMRIYFYSNVQFYIYTYINSTTEGYWLGECRYENLGNMSVKGKRNEILEISQVYY